MDKQFEQAKKQLHEEELSDFTFTNQMKHQILNEIHSKKATKKRQHFFPILLTACFFGAFSVGMYQVIQNQEGNGKNTEGVEEPPVKIEQPKEDSETTVPQPEKEPVVTEEEPVVDKTEEEPVSDNKEEVVPEKTVQESVSEEPTSQEPVLVDTANYFDEEFVNQLKQGYLKGSPISFHSTVGDVKALYGEPKSYSAEEGAYLLVYEQFDFVYPYGSLSYETQNQVTDDVPIIGLSIKLQEPNYFSDMKKVLDEPEWAGYHESRGVYVQLFQINEYSLLASSGQNDGVDPQIVSVRLGRIK